MIAKRIKNLRVAHDMTQKELAIYLGLTPKMISFYELGQLQFSKKRTKPYMEK